MNDTTAIVPPRWESPTRLLVHRRLADDIVDVLPPQVEMRVRSIMAYSDSGHGPFTVAFECGDGPYQVNPHDLEHIVDILRERGYPDLASLDAVTQAAAYLERESGDKLPGWVGLCPDPAHTGEFYMPLDEAGARRCPEPGCTRELVVYQRMVWS